MSNIKLYFFFLMAKRFTHSPLLMKNVPKTLLYRNGKKFFFFFFFFFLLNQYNKIKNKNKKKYIYIYIDELINYL